MTDEIIAKLSTLEGWKVMNMTSVLRYKNTEKTIKDIGQELNVTSVLLGSVRKEEDDIRVTTQLVNVEDDFQLWSNTYEQKLERVFEIQSDVAEKIAKALEMKLSHEDKALIQQKPTENMRAYNLYAQGRYFFNKRTNKDYQKAIDYYEQAIKEDPNYALAYSGIADSYLLLEQFGTSSRGFTGVKEAIQKALEIDDAIGEAHASMGLLKMEEWNWEEAERELKRALDLNPNYASAHRCYAEFLIYMGRFDEAFKELHHALELNPFSLPINREAGHIYYLSRKYDQAQEALKRTIEMNPNFPLVHASLGLVYLQKSMFEEALAEFEREKQALLASEMGMFQIGVNPLISITYACMGNLEEAEKILEQAKSIVGIDYYKACYYFVIGEDDKGFECLEKAFVMKESFMRYIKVDPLLDRVRSDPRFDEILKKMNLE
jgi:tetratricopeptide (TPR) repeat protein